MSIFLNPVVFSVILMCILCLCKLNVMFSLIIACFVGGLMGGMSVSDISSTMLAGFSNNAEAALAYILLGAFASCLAYNAVESTKLELRHWISIAAVLVVTAVEFKTQSLAVAALAGLVIMFFSGAVKWKDIEERFNDGIRMMGSIAFIMLVAGGFGMVMRATGGVNALVERSASALSSSRLLAATVITLIGLVVTMGIGTSFGTIPVIAVLFVPLCTKLGFSPAATILMISSAAALGDAGSPASDATLGPTCGLNADGQHDHIWDTCVPTFGALNIPLMIGTIIIAQFI